MRILLAVLTLCAFIGLPRLRPQEVRDLPFELHRALLQQDEEAVAEILRAGPQTVNQAWHGYTPLQVALSQTNWHNLQKPLMLVEMLLAAGADVNQSGKACFFGSSPQLPLQAAAWHYETPARKIRLLLDAGAQVDPPSPEGTPLVIAARRDNLTCIRMLLAAGADPNRHDDEGLTPLHWAARNAKPQTLAFLLEAGAKVDVPSEKGSALCLAAHFDEKCVDLLLKAGADPNFHESNGWTPLHYGASSGGPTVIRRLLAAGALPATRSDVGESALDVARSYGHRDEEAVLNASETFPVP